MAGSSLKGYTPRLAEILGSTPGALYERQRELARAGLLDQDQQDGRGPGSGVRTSWGSVALLVTSMLATDSLSDSATRTKSIADARPKRGKCPLTRATSFRSALSIILGSTGGTSRIVDISISRTSDDALIRYWDTDRQIALSEFGGPKKEEPSIAVRATLGAGAFQAIGRDVEAIMFAELEDEDQAKQTRKRQ